MKRKKLLTFTMVAALGLGNVMSASAADFTDLAATEQEQTDFLSNIGQEQTDSGEKITEADDASAVEIEQDAEESEISDESEDFSSESVEVEIAQEDTAAETSDVGEEISTEEDFTDSEESADAVGASSGTCGKNVKWKISGSTLTLSGSGAMDDYWSSYSVPWREQREYISKVVIDDNITTIGDW